MIEPLAPIDESAMEAALAAKREHDREQDEDHTTEGGRNTRRDLGLSMMVVSGLVLVVGFPCWILWGRARVAKERQAAAAMLFELQAATNNRVPLC
eukprot:SAG11_NODE_1513_length_4767_cov_2.236718_3_plen_96_part_00